MLSFPIGLLRNILRLLIPVSVVLTLCLYIYPVLLQCSFPQPEHATSSAPAEPQTAFLNTLKLHLPLTTKTGPNGIVSRLAPFRLLSLGDPQLEGDTSIPNARGESFPHLIKAYDHLAYKTHHDSLRARIRQALHDLVDFGFEDIPRTLESIRKRIDLVGNDLYLAHIYRTLDWWTQPTHVSVLGDLLGSQWLDEDEFNERAGRYWNRVMKGGRRLPDELMLFPEGSYELSGYLGNKQHIRNRRWAKQIINIAGNHDVGYAGDLTEDRRRRFERAFGKLNFELRFELDDSRISPAWASLTTDDGNILYFDNTTKTSSDSNADYQSETLLAPELRIIVLNSMNLDTPAFATPIQDDTYAFVNAAIGTATAVDLKGHATLVLTHIPLYKPEGTCVDPPLFSFYDSDHKDEHGSSNGGTLREQNQLSEDASRGFVEGIFGLSSDTMAPGNGRGRRGLVMNGHDHEGCDVLHYVDQTAGTSGLDRPWQVTKWDEAVDQGLVGRAGMPSLREITVRSMMGGFGGNAGLLSAWFDEEEWEWKFEYATCALGSQVWWWAVHITDLVAIIGCLLSLGSSALESVFGQTSVQKASKAPAEREHEARRRRSTIRKAEMGPKMNGGVPPDEKLARARLKAELDALDSQATLAEGDAPIVDDSADEGGTHVS